MILVTGGTGFIGAHLLLSLTETNDRVRAIFRTLESQNKTRNLFELYNKIYLFERIEWVEADINDIELLDIAFAKITHVYHCAALVSFDPRDELKLRKINIEGTANIVNFCLYHNIEKLCYVSSIAALGDAKTEDDLITESTEWNAERLHSDYSITKHGAEIEVWRGEQEGLNVVIVNPSIVLGPGFWDSGSGQIFSNVEKGLKYYTLGTAAFIAVTDVVKQMIALMNSDISGKRFILSAENISYRDLINWISDTLKKPRPTSEGKEWMTNLVWRLDGIKTALFGGKRTLTKITAQSLHSTTLYSNDAIKGATSATFIPIKEYLKKLRK